MAIFMYVGGEVSVGSAIINFLGHRRWRAISQLEASSYVALYWGGLMIGRFMGAFALSDMRSRNKQLWLAAFPVAAFVILWAVSGWSVVQSCICPSSSCAGCCFNWANRSPAACW